MTDIQYERVKIIGNLTTTKQYIELYKSELERVGEEEDQTALLWAINAQQVMKGLVETLCVL